MYEKMEEEGPSLVTLTTHKRINIIGEGGLTREEKKKRRESHSAGEGTNKANRLK